MSAEFTEGSASYGPFPRTFSVRDTESSAALRQAQTALAASQADLGAMEAKRDLAVEVGEQWKRERDEALAELASARIELAQGQARYEELKGEFGKVRRERDGVRSFWRICSHHRDGLRAEIDRLRAELASQSIGRRTFLEALGADPATNITPLMAAQSVRAELDRLREGKPFLVAVQEIGDCAVCGVRIGRGVAYVRAEIGKRVHLHCP